MKFYKFITCLVFISIPVFGSDSDKEYKIELLIYTYNKVNTIESFNTIYEVLDSDHIKYYDNDDNNRNSNFSNISQYLDAILVGDSLNAIKLYPKIWLRDSNKIDTLKIIKNNLINDKNKELINSKSWIQTIPEFDSSRSISYLNNEDNYGFLFKLYKKRFIHVELEGFIISEDDEINKYINIDQRVFNDEVYFFDHPYFGIILSLKEI